MLEILDIHNGRELRKEDGLKYSILLQKSYSKYHFNTVIPDRVRSNFKVWQYDKDAEENIITNLELVLSYDVQAKSLDDVVLTVLAGAAKNGNDPRIHLMPQIRRSLRKYDIVLKNRTVNKHYPVNPSMDSFWEKAALFHDAITSKKGAEELKILLGKLQTVEEINKDPNKRRIIIRNLQEALRNNFENHLIPINTPAIDNPKTKEFYHSVLEDEVNYI